MIRELTGLYHINAFLAFVPSSKPMPLVSVFSSPDQMKSPFRVSPFSVQGTSEIPIMSNLKRFISFLSSSNFSAVHSVCTFRVPTFKVFLTGFSLCVFPVVCLVFKYCLVANFRLCSGSSTGDADLVHSGDVRAGIESYNRRSWLVSVVFLFYKRWYLHPFRQTLLLSPDL